MERDHCKIVTECLQELRVIDEQSLSSMAVLDERLERVKQLGSMFANIDLSPEAKKLKRQKTPIAVC